MTLADDAPTALKAPIPGTLGRLASRVYGLAIGRINRKFDAGRGVVTLDRPVVSVGNLSTGGTGKTPMVMHVVRLLRGAGRDPCIAMRGYGNADGSLSDEAQEYARQLAGLPVPQHRVADAVGPDLPIVAQANRIAGLLDLFATERGEAVDCVVLDDGFQHRRIARDLDIVLIDATRSPFCDALLPAGHLREGVASLSRAQVVVITHAECSHADDVATLRVQIHEQQPQAHIVVARHDWKDLVETGPEGDHFRPVSFLRGKMIAAACAIGNPLAFLDAVKTHAGRELVYTLSLRDHDPYSDATVERLLAALREKRPDAMVVTEKDWSKLRRVSFREWPCPVVRPRLEMAFTCGGDELDARVLEACRPQDHGPENPDSRNQV